MWIKSEVASLSRTYSIMAVGVRGDADRSINQTRRDSKDNGRFWQVYEGLGNNI